MQKTTLHISGMSCGHCIGAVKKALSGVDGLAAQDVAIGTATVEYDEGRVSPDQIAKAVSSAGYPARAA